HLDDVYQTISHLSSALDDDASDVAALAELDRVYAKQKMWFELLDIVDKRALLTTDTQARADLAFRAAHTVEVQLPEPYAAIPRCGGVLQIVPCHTEALSSLEALMAKEDHIEPVAAILERIYRSEGRGDGRAEKDATGLIRVYERRLTLEGRDQAARRADWE